MMQNSRLKYFLEKGYYDRTSKILNVFSSRIVARKIFESQSNNKARPFQKDDGDQEQMTAPPYVGNHEIVKELIEYFEKYRHPALQQVILFGSLADQTNCSYSDFDGILMIDTYKIKDWKSLYNLRILIKNSELFLFRIDSMQHHGWLIETCPSDSVPIPLKSLAGARTLFPFQETLLFEKVHEPVERFQQIERTIRSILRKINKAKGEKNLFEFKILCSEFMLLPALALQAFTGKSIPKRDSFEVFFKTFPEMEREPMDMVSKWRSNWHQPPLNNKTRLFHSFRKSGLSIPILCPQVETSIWIEYNEKWKKHAATFCLELQKIIAERKHQE